MLIIPLYVIPGMTSKAVLLLHGVIMPCWGLPIRHKEVIRHVSRASVDVTAICSFEDLGIPQITSSSLFDNNSFTSLKN